MESVAQPSCTSGVGAPPAHTIYHHAAASKVPAGSPVAKMRVTVQHRTGGLQAHRSSDQHIRPQLPSLAHSQRGPARVAKRARWRWAVLMAGVLGVIFTVTSLSNFSGSQKQRHAMGGPPARQLARDWASSAKLDELTVVIPMLGLPIVAGTGENAESSRAHAVPGVVTAMLGGALCNVTNGSEDRVRRVEVVLAMHVAASADPQDSWLQSWALKRVNPKGSNKEKLRVWSATPPHGARSSSSCVVDIRVVGAAWQPSERWGSEYAALVEAGLAAVSTRTSHFAVVADFVQPVEVTGGAGGPPRGFLDVLLSAARRNAGRVTAVQCTLMMRTPSGADADAGNLVVADKGGAAAMSIHPAQRAAGFSVVRRLNGYGGRDQRVLWEDPVDMVSPYCALYHRDAYDAVGGLLGGSPAGPAAQSSEWTASGAVDFPGWELSLRQSEVLPDWQAWNAAALAVVEAVARPFFRPSYPVTDWALTRWTRTLTVLQQARGGRRLLLRHGGRIPSSISSSGSWSLDEAVVFHSRQATSLSVGYLPAFFCGCCGLAMESYGYLVPLAEARLVFTANLVEDECSEMPAAALDAIRRSRLPLDGDFRYIHDALWLLHDYDVDIIIIHGISPLYELSRQILKSYLISRHLCEFTNVLPMVAEQLDLYADEVWVTGPFFTKVFERSGISPRKIFVVPEAVDVYIYDPGAITPLQHFRGDGQVWDSRYGYQPFTQSTPFPPGSTEAGYTFLSIFKWEPRKGWDVLLAAYWKAFGPHSPHHHNVTLVLKVHFIQAYAASLTVDNFPEFLHNYSSDMISGYSSLSQWPRIIVHCENVTVRYMARLYRTVDAFVLPTRGEGWGLPIIEAMSMGLPVLTTNWGGATGFITRDTAFGIPLDGVQEIPANGPYPYFPGQKWALPSVDGTAELMRYVFENREHAREVGRRARRHVVEHYSQEAVADIFLEHFSRVKVLAINARRSGDGVFVSSGD